MRAVVVLGLLLGAAACSGPPPPTAAPEAPLESPAGEASQPGVALLAEPWLPPWAGPATPVEIAERAALRFCGVEAGPEIDVGVRTCFLDSVTADRDIEFARLETTIEGDPIATIFGFEPGGGYVMLTDSTQDRFGPRAWAVRFCTLLVEDPASMFRLENCRAGPEFR